MNLRKVFKFFIAITFCFTIQNAQAMDLFCPSDRVRNFIDILVHLQYDYCVMADHFATFNVGQTNKKFIEFAESFKKFMGQQAQKIHDKAHEEEGNYHKCVHFPLQNALLERIRITDNIFNQSFISKYKKHHEGDDFLISPDQMSEYVKWYVNFYTHTIIKIATTALLDHASQQFDLTFISGLCQELKSMGYENFIHDNYKQHCTGPLFINILEHTSHNQNH
jgi:hypothetical protein